MIRSAPATTDGRVKDISLAHPEPDILAPEDQMLRRFERWVISGANRTPRKVGEKPDRRSSAHVGGVPSNSRSKVHANHHLMAINERAVARPA